MAENESAVASLDAPPACPVPDPVVAPTTTGATLVGFPISPAEQEMLGLAPDEIADRWVTLLPDGFLLGALAESNHRAGRTDAALAKDITAKGKRCSKPTVVGYRLTWNVCPAAELRYGLPYTHWEKAVAVAYAHFGDDYEPEDVRLAIDPYMRAASENGSPYRKLVANLRGDFPSTRPPRGRRSLMAETTLESGTPPPALLPDDAARAVAWLRSAEPEAVASLAATLSPRWVERLVRQLLALVELEDASCDPKHLSDWEAEPIIALLAERTPISVLEKALARAARTTDAAREVA